MDELRDRPTLVPIMQQLMEVQACAGCCLRVAGLRSPQAFKAAAGMTTLELLDRLFQPAATADNQAEAGSLAGGGREGEQGAASGAPGAHTPAGAAVEAADVKADAIARQLPSAAAAPPLRAAAVSGQKRGREEGEAAQVPAAAAEADGMSAPDTVEGAGSAAQSSTPAAATCPLCFGLLPALAGGAAGSTAVALRVALDPPAWRAPSLEQFLGLPAFMPAVTNAPSERAGADGHAQAGAVEGAAGQQAERAQQRRVVPCTDLAEAAAHLAAEFEFAPGGAANSAPAAESAAGFALELSMPASLAVRAQALWWRLQSALGAEAVSGLRDVGIVDVKEALKLVATSHLTQALGQPSNPQAALRISLAVSYPASAPEAAWLAADGGSQQQQQGRRKRWGRWGGRGGGGGRGARERGAADGGKGEGPAAEEGAGGVELVASETLARRLADMPCAEFLASCPPSPAQLAAPAASASAEALPAGEAGSAAAAAALGVGAEGPRSMAVAAARGAPAAGPVVQLSCQRRPIYVGGRYLKLRRGIPQSPWFIDGVRKGESSVEEEIGNVVLPPLRPDACSFISAGREDFDVRMLGAGRPFVLEVRNARAAPPTPQACMEMQRVINEAGSGVAVRHLSVISPMQVAQLKEGEADKEKSYAAVCWLPRPLSDADVAAMEATNGLVIQQQTPVRVLHRRANLTRPRTVHSLRVERLAGQLQYFVLHLRTQAGTYVKEFVHGDMGRTRPSLGDLLGGCQAQITYLDVSDIHMDFLD